MFKNSFHLHQNQRLKITQKIDFFSKFSKDLKNVSRHCGGHYNIKLSSQNVIYPLLPEDPTVSMLKALIWRNNSVKKPRSECKRRHRRQEPRISQLSLLHIKPGGSFCYKLWSLANLLEIVKVKVYILANRHAVILLSYLLNICQSQNTKTYIYIVIMTFYSANKHDINNYHLFKIEIYHRLNQHFAKHKTIKCVQNSVIRNWLNVQNINCVAVKSGY